MSENKLSFSFFQILVAMSNSENSTIDEMDDKLQVVGASRMAPSPTTDTLDSVTLEPSPLDEQCEVCQLCIAVFCFSQRHKNQFNIYLYSRHPDVDRTLLELNTVIFYVERYGQE